MSAKIVLLFVFCFLFLFPSPLFAFTQESNTTATKVGNPPETNGCINRVFYWQGDPRWQNTCDMANSGCGPTSMAMILSSFGDTITPNIMDQQFREQGFRSCNDGSRMVTAIQSILPAKGYTYVQVPVNGSQLDLKKAKEYLDNGYLIIGSTANHIFVMYDADIAANTVQLMDPARKENAPGVTRPNAYPWIQSDGGWIYAYAIKKEGSCSNTTTPGSAADSVCTGDAVTFGVKMILPRQTQTTCKATDTGTCGRADKCIVPTKIVLHTTVSPLDADGIYNYFAKGAGGRGVGTQFVIGKDGKVIQMVEMFSDKTEVAYGTAYYNEEIINIELTDTGVYSSKNDAPQAQYQAALSLVKKLMSQYHIPKGNLEYDWKSNTDTRVNVSPGVFGHYQLNPSNRTDPGAGFMKDFRTDL